MQQDSASFWSDIKTLEGQLAANPDSYCFARLADIYLKVGLADDALHTARQGVAKHPGYIAGQRVLAFASTAKGLTEEAVAALNYVTAASPDDREAQAMLGKLYMQSGNTDAAIEVFRTVLDFFPDDAECRLELETLQRAAVENPAVSVLDEDEEIIEDIEILDIEETDLLFEEEDEFSGEETVRVDAVNQPVAQDPLNTTTIAELYVQQGFITKALEVYRNIFAENPGDTEISFRIAELETMIAEPVQPPDPLPDFVAPSFEPVPDNNFMYVEPAIPAASEFVDIPQRGSADNALEALEGWLENIRRIKACR